jgi:Transcription factor Iwr1
MAASGTAVIRLKRKRNEDPLTTLCTPSHIPSNLTFVDLGGNDSVVDASAKRPKQDHPAASIFTLAITVDSEEDFASINRLALPNMGTLDLSASSSRPDSRDSDASASRKRSFAQLVDVPKFRVSRKKQRQEQREAILLDYEVFDAVREPTQTRRDEVPEIKPSGIPDEIQSGDPARDAILHDMLRSYLTVDSGNRTYVNIKDEYVYDIYYRTAASPDTVPTDANFGVLVYDSESELLAYDDEEVGDEEDADSNSEGYYQNSYPDEDEWAGDGWGSEAGEDDDEDYGKRRSSGKILYIGDDELVSISGDEVSYSDIE